MKTIIINGSPKGKKGNTEIFIQNFISGMKREVEVRRIIEEGYDSLASIVKEYDTIILALPLYIHSMPGIVMRFIEHLEANSGGLPKQIGFILQCGFPEGSQCSYLVNYFRSLSVELKMEYLGTFIKTDAAGTYMMPSLMTKKLFQNLRKFGEIYENTGKFDMDIMQKMMQPVDIKGFKLKFMKFAKKIGLMDIMWNKFLKENNAFDHRFDKPLAVD